MQFGKSQKIKFESDNGTYSIVTPRENKDSQITATGEEAQLFISFFGRENIQLGNVGSNPEKARKTGSSEFPMGKSQTMVKNVVQESFFMEIFK